MRKRDNVASGKQCRSSDGHDLRGEYYDCDGQVTQDDFLAWQDCLAGPNGGLVGLMCQVHVAEPVQIVILQDSGAFWR